ncbi:MAG: HAD-IA family hydrolase [Solirubrobacterales bacterium]|nr:HAD-IA family hydrolase [Solirubrobacterales bacterium]
MLSFDAVLFDFAGTLSAPRTATDQLRIAAPHLGEVEIASLASRLTAAGLPGGPYPTTMPDHAAESYAARDVDEATHRLAYTTLIETVVAPDLARSIYDLVRIPAGWVVYADAFATLEQLRQLGVRLGVVTNVGYDLLPVAEGLGLRQRLDAWTSSAVVGAAKPDPRIFEVALASLGVAAERCLMVGDNPEADAGGVALGLTTILLPMSHPGAHHGLGTVVRAAGA